ncbi:MAG: Ig-like domain-containing protein, partial [Candidatus Lokiarchaeota archaeon]|nr:Ig-like domain-containing protein [Candidatus Lokiarchaeota archaeon]
MKTVAMLALLILLGFGIVYAQGDEITLKLSRDFGYASGTGKIQGLFSMKVTSSTQLSEVVFYIDSKSIGKDALEPFKLQFNTDDFSPGVHSLYAIGQTVE